MSSNILVRRICEQCGKEFDAKTTVTRFCTKPCNSKYHKQRVKDLKIQVSNYETKSKVIAPNAELNSKEFLSVDKTCRLLGVSRMTLYRQIKSKKLKLKRIGRRVIIKRSELEKQFLT